MVIGDMNAKVGVDVTRDIRSVGRYGLGVRNDNGSRFVDLCDAAGLVIGGTLFPHRNILLGT